MCNFCDKLFKQNSEMQWNMRSEYSDSNFCEKVLNNNCSDCDECFTQYKLSGYIHNNNAYICCDYKYTNGDIMMWNYTESLPINHCPYCGKQLSKDIVDFNSIGSHIATMAKKNN